MPLDYQPGHHVIWSGSTYCRTPVDEFAIVVADGGKDRVLILCLDGRERWVKKGSVRRIKEQ